jgi:CPA2 family monovalent cation:H+ antiporter-2
MVSSLDLTLVLLIAAVGGVVVCRLAHLPPMLGYLAVGVVIGPSAIGVAADADGVSHLAEFGIVFLMFVIGLEFNLPKLQSMRRLVFGLGLSQVVLTILAALAGNAALAAMPSPGPRAASSSSAGNDSAGSSMRLASRAGGPDAAGVRRASSRIGRF